MTEVDGPRRVFFGVGGVLVLVGLVGVAWGLPHLDPELASPGPAYVVVFAIPLLTMGAGLLFQAAGDGMPTAGGGSWSIETTSPAPAICCWVGALVLLGVVLTHLAAFGQTATLAGALVVGFMVNWGRLSYVGWRRSVRGG